MDPPKSQLTHKTLNIIFIGAEAIVSIVLIVLIGHFAETTSSMMVDIIKLGGSLFLAASVPVWGIGAFHLHKTGKMANYLKALLSSLGISLLLVLITAFLPYPISLLPYPFIYWIILASVIIVFNYFALK